MDDLSPTDVSDWQEWDVSDYLNTYFTAPALGSDSFEAWKFLISELKKIDGAPKKILDFGCGPTIFGAIPCAPYATEIHVCDYLKPNLEAIQEWIIEGPGMFDWTGCIKEVLRLEGTKDLDVNVKIRESELRNKIVKLKKCDAGKSPAIEATEKYPLIISTYCVDSATNSKETWNLFMKNLLDLLDKKGTILLTALKKCESYKVGTKDFPCANIDENDMQDAFEENGFKKEDCNIQVCEAEDCEDEGFSGLIFVKATKN